jgi:HSP20 family protein
MWNLIPWRKERPEQGGNLMVGDPFEREFARVREEFDNLLSRMWSGGPLMGDRRFGDRSQQPWGFDVEETDSHYLAHFDAPGFEVGDFDVKISGNQLTVSAERKESKEGKNGSSIRYGRFERSLYLPEGADIEQIEARYHNGVLELKIPKGQDAQNVKRIEVKSA